MWALKCVPDDEMSTVHKKLGGRVLSVGKQVCLGMDVYILLVVSMTVGASDVICTQLVNRVHNW